MTGQEAYEEDVRRWPTYDNGQPRIAWAQLADHEQASWNMNPMPRKWREPSSPEGCPDCCTKIDCGQCWGTKRCEKHSLSSPGAVK